MGVIPVFQAGATPGTSLPLVGGNKRVGVVGVGYAFSAGPPSLTLPHNGEGKRSASQKTLTATALRYVKGAQWRRYRQRRRRFRRRSSPARRSGRDPGDGRAASCDATGRRSWPASASS